VLDSLGDQQGGSADRCQPEANLEDLHRGGVPTCHRKRRVLELALILFFALALIALLKCKREDVPEVIRALASWWRFWLRP